MQIGIAVLAIMATFLGGAQQDSAPLGQDPAADSARVNAVMAGNLFPKVGFTFVQRPGQPIWLCLSCLLRDSKDVPRTGPSQVTISLYGEKEGGDVLWSEAQTVEADNQGGIRMMIGAAHPEGLPIDLFRDSQSLWLGVRVGAEPELTPRLVVVYHYPVVFWGSINGHRFPRIVPAPKGPAVTWGNGEFPEQELRRLGFSEADIEVVREAASRLQEELRDLDTQIAALGQRASAPDPQHARGAAEIAEMTARQRELEPGVIEQIRQLEHERMEVMRRDMDSLLLDLGPQLAPILENFVQRDFVHQSCAPVSQMAPVRGHEPRRLAPAKPAASDSAQ